MGFVEEVIKENESIWEECLNTDFVRKLSDGTLDEECFKGYMIDDSIYLREYAKVFAWGIVNAYDIKNYYSFLSFVNESESATRVYYINKYGIKDSEVWKMTARKENKDYTDGEYDKLCDKWIAYAEEKCKILSEEEKKECKDIFTKCSKYELGFWKMSERKREK